MLHVDPIGAAKPERRKPGPKPMDPAGSTPVSLRLPNSMFDRLDTYARQHAVDLSTLIREAIDLRWGRRDADNS